MDARTSWFKSGLVFLTAFATFFAALFLGQWLARAASMAMFPLAAGTAPDAFLLMHETSAADARHKYEVVSWRTYAAQRDNLGIRTLRLPASAGSIRPKATYSFRVLEDDGTRQLVEVQFEGPYRSWSRYEAYRDRAVPVAYYSSGSEDSRWPELARFVVLLLFSGLAAGGAAAGVRRLLGLRPAQ